MRIKTPCKSEP